MPSRHVQQGRKDSNPLCAGWSRTALPGARPCQSVAQVGIEPTASRVLSSSGLPVAYRASLHFQDTLLFSKVRGFFSLFLSVVLRTTEGRWALGPRWCCFRIAPHFHIPRGSGSVTRIFRSGSGGRRTHMAAFAASRFSKPGGLATIARFPEQSGWPDLNRRFPVPQTGGLNQTFPHPEKRRPCKSQKRRSTTGFEPVLTAEEAVVLPLH